MTAFRDAPPRVEAALKVTGAARFPAETPVDEMLHACLVVAPIARGRVLAIDAARARACAGFVQIFTHENLPPLRPASFLMLLREPIIHFAGQPIALVVGETPWQAAAAATAVAVAYEPSPPITTVAQAVDQAFAPKEAGRVATDSRRGDPERGLAEADMAIERCYTTPAHNHNPLEPNAVIASWNGDHVTVHTTTQAIFGTRRVVAHCFGLPLDQVRVLAKYVGGGFGAKTIGWFPCLVLCIAAARHLGRPLKLELTRPQMFTLVGRRQETVQHLKLGAARDGRLTAIVHDTIAQTSTFGEYADPNGSMSRWLYACDNVATSHRLVRVNAPQPKAMRAPGEGTGSFALESALDELAHELAMDPIELRLRNYADHDQHAGLPWSSKGLRECYRVAAQNFGWERRPRAIGALGAERYRLGWGMASACFPVYRMASEAAVRMDPDGRVLVRCGTQDIGTGTYTVLTQLAANTLGVPFGWVTAELGDTCLPEGPYSGAHLATASFAPRSRRRRARFAAVSLTWPSLIKTRPSTDFPRMRSQSMRDT
jgi:xanthine dehydrogenase YagR molybdenum-binding subunit